MKARPFTIVGLLLLVIGMAAPASADDDLAAKRDAKLAQPWVKAGGWITDFQCALAESKKSDRLVLAYFTRSYAPCPFCTQFEKAALADPAFPELAKNYVLYLNVTSHVPTDKDQDLFAKKGGRGFPFIVFLDGEGAVLREHDGPRTVKGLEESAALARARLELVKKAASGDRDAKMQILVEDLEQHRLKVADSDKAVAALGELSAQEKKKLDELKRNVEVEEVVLGVHTHKQAFDAGKRLLEEHRAGKPEPTHGETFHEFWKLVMFYAERAKDVAGFEEGYNARKSRLGKTADAKRQLYCAEKWLAEVKGTPLPSPPPGALALPSDTSPVGSSAPATSQEPSSKSVAAPTGQ